MVVQVLITYTHKPQIFYDLKLIESRQSNKDSMLLWRQNQLFDAHRTKFKGWLSAKCFNECCSQLLLFRILPAIRPSHHYMGRKLKRGTRGLVAQYITRAASLKKLQLSLADFRRLCILKGVYPRDPKRKLKGADKTYYHTKDITYLQHEPLIQKFRDIRVYDKRFSRAIGRREKSVARSLEERKPVYALFHLVKERYPTLLDAVKDLDDAISTVALFASLATCDEKSVDSESIAQATRLLDEMLLYITEKRILRKVFVSIKGYYIQITILNEKITFLMPHQFPQELPPEVDFRVMLTFLEFYSCLLNTVNFKLYLMANLKYPPIANHDLVRAGCRHLALSTKSVSSEISPPDDAVQSNVSKVDTLKEKLKDGEIKPDDEEEEEEEDNQPEEQGVNDDEDNQPEKFEGDTSLEEIQAITEDEKRIQSLFSKLTFFVSREVPRIPVVLCLQSCGAAVVGWQGEGTSIEESDSRITHHIIDRPLSDSLVGYTKDREFVQPQWVFDSLNACTLQPVGPYAPGLQPPPHLSPFVEDIDHGYVPRQRSILQEITEDAKRRETELLLTNADEKNEEEEEEEEEDEDVEDVELEETAFHKEVVAEKLDLPPVMEENSEMRKVKRRQKKDAEEIERRKALLGKKRKCLLERIEFGQQRKKDQINKLESRRKIGSVRNV